MIKQQFKIVFSVLILISLIPTAQSKFYRYFRELQCSNITNNRCTKWTESLFITKTTSLFYCFPATTYLSTKNGPKTMAELQVGDEVMGINPQTGKVGYSKLTNWLHRDGLGETEYQALKLENGTYFQASAYHNLGFYDEKGKINYKFANQFKGGDQLVGFPGQPIKVMTRDSGFKRKGLFSPYTEFKNYFVYSTDFKKEDKNSGSMILAHVLSQVQNPLSKDTLTGAMMWGTNLLGNAYQPQANEVYHHPSITHLSFLFGNSWKVAHNTVTYAHEDWLTALDVRTTHNSYTSSNAAARERQRKITYAITSIIAMLNNPISF